MCFIFPAKGDWHQYDDIICAEPSKIHRWKDKVKDAVKGVLWNEQQPKLIEGREIAGNIMLETIFDLLSVWTETNLKSFLTQLNQFFEVYGNPCVYEDRGKRWDSLQFNKDNVSSASFCDESKYFMVLPPQSDPFYLWFNFIGEENPKTVHVDKRDSSAEGEGGTKSVHPRPPESSSDHASCVETV